MRLGIIAVLISSIMLSGCATIFNGKNVSMKVDSQPEGAVCLISGDVGDIDRVQTPAKVKVPNQSGMLSFDCEYNGEKRTKIVGNTTSGWIYANVGLLIFGFFPGIIGSSVDLITGSYKTYPKSQKFIFANVAPASTSDSTPASE